jgi:hypothetical protein
MQSSQLWQLAGGYQVSKKQHTTSILKNAVFWDVTLCRSCVNRRSSRLLTLVPRSRIFLLWRWRLYLPPKRWFTQDLHSATCHKTIFFMVTAVKTSNLTYFHLHGGNDKWQYAEGPRDSDAGVLGTKRCNHLSDVTNLILIRKLIPFYEITSVPVELSMCVTLVLFNMHINFIPISLCIFLMVFFRKTFARFVAGKRIYQLNLHLF